MLDEIRTQPQSQSRSQEGRSSPPLAGKRVLIIVENLPVPFDRRVWQEARALRSAGAEVAVICPTGKGYSQPFEDIEGIKVYRHPLPVEAASTRGYLMEYATALFWQLRLSFLVWRKHGFDVIQACNPPDLIFLVALPFKLMGKKFIFDHHDINPELYEAKFNRRDLFWRVIRWLERLSFGLADVSIATNNSYRQIAMGRGKMKAENVFVVRSGPDLARFNVVNVEPNFCKGRRYLVGYVGVMGDQEGIDLLLESVAELVRRGRRDIEFCLVGGGPSLASLRAMAGSMGINDFVTFTGRVPDQTLLSILASSDICVNPDRVNEMNNKSSMNKIVEYMAMRKAIVQFDVVEGRFSAKDSSLYAKPNDPVDFASKIEELLADPARRRDMGEAGFRRVQTTLSWDHQTPPLIAAYRKALGLDAARAPAVQ